jgi:hypothetical protein
MFHQHGHFSFARDAKSACKRSTLKATRLPSKPVLIFRRFNENLTSELMQHVTAFSRPQPVLAAPAIARKPKENLRIAKASDAQFLSQSPK